MEKTVKKVILCMQREHCKEDHSMHAEGLAAHSISFIRFCFLLLLLGWLQQGAGSTAEDAGFYIHRQHAGGVLQQQLL